MTRTFDLVELKTRSILTCVVSEASYDLLRLQASFDGTAIFRIESEVICSSRVGFALVADEQRRFMSNLQSMLFGHLTIEDLKVLSRKINFPNCEELLF